jgi:hypothetical protein
MLVPVDPGGEQLLLLEIGRHEVESACRGGGGEALARFQVRRDGLEAEPFASRPPRDDAVLKEWVDWLRRS